MQEEQELQGGNYFWEDSEDGSEGKREDLMGTTSKGFRKESTKRRRTKGWRKLPDDRHNRATRRAK